MDIPRPKTRSYRPHFLAGSMGLTLILVTLGLSRLRNASPTVERSALWVDRVKRGPMLREVKGSGTLVPENIRWITADTAGRVERIALRPGAVVREDTELLQLSNPDVMLQELEAERQLAGAQADLINLRSRLSLEVLAQQSSLAALRTELLDARRRAIANQQLLRNQMASELECKQSDEKAEELATRLDIEQRRLAVLTRGLSDQLQAQQLQVEKLRAVAQFRKQQVESMRVKPGWNGVLQELPLQLGQWVTPGSLLAKVVQPERLKAELRIPEIQAKDLQLGQSAEIDTHNGVASGQVTRIEPAANQGTVLVEVSFRDELPRGARPDLTVEGTIQLERLADVLYLGRPAGSQPESVMELYKVSRDGDAAQRVKVKLGRSSVNSVEVRSGLIEGDRVVLSDMTSLDSAERLRLK